MGNGLAKKILFIEDESALQRALVGVMAERGIKILSALDGEAGLKAAQAEQPDLILLDLVLPQNDGFGVLKELRANAATANAALACAIDAGEYVNARRFARNHLFPAAALSAARPSLAGEASNAAAMPARALADCMRASRPSNCALKSSRAGVRDSTSDSNSA